MITWNIIRAAGIGAYLMLWASVAWGLASTTSLFGKKIPKATSIALHQAFGTTGLVLLVTHLAFLLYDSFLPFGPLDLVVPMRSTYRPVGVTLGIASMFLLLLGVFATSWGRKLIGTKWWRRMHSLAIPAFTLALLHGLAAGTDARRVWLFSMYAGTAAIVFFLLITRALTVTVRKKREAVEAGLHVVGSPVRERPAAHLADAASTPVERQIG